jgi:hypothetical protein
MAITSGRGRGRPRKDPHHKTDPRNRNYSNAEQTAGGFTDLKSGFATFCYDLLKGIGKIEEHPLYKELTRFVETDDTE